MLWAYNTWGNYSELDRAEGNEGLWMGSSRTLGKGNFGTGRINNREFRRAASKRTSFKVRVFSSHLHPFLTFILVTSLPCFLHLPNPSFANIGQKIFLCSADSRSTVGFGFGTDYSWVETVCRIQPRAPHSVSLVLSLWKELSKIEGLFWVGGLLRKAMGARACVETGSLNWTVSCNNPRAPGRGTRLLSPGHSLSSWNNQIRVDL